MAFGNSNNNQNSEMKQYSLKSKISLYNEGKLNHTNLRVEYFNGLIGFKISPCITAQDGSLKVNNDATVSLYLTPLKARVFLNAMKSLFLCDDNSYYNIGIDSSNGLITFSFGKDYGMEDTPMIAIRKIDPDNGSVISSLTYEFKEDIQPIVNFMDDNPSNQRASLNGGSSQEIDMILEALEDFIRNANGASTYWDGHYNSYQQMKMDNLLKSMAQQLGVDIGTKKNGYNKPSGSFFNNNNNTNYEQNSQSAYDLDDM